MNESLTAYLDPVFQVLNYNLFSLGNASITPLTILYILVLAVLLLYISSKFKSLFISRLLVRTKLDIGAQQAIGTILRYVVLFVGFIIILQTVGIDLTALNVLAGAVGIGIGFGLQNIANNFISGLIIMFERPIKVGDRVEVDDVNGKVMSIGARSTTIRTNDGIFIIVPNSKFISENVTNWSFGADIIRFRIAVGVAYDSDVDLVQKLLHEVAKESPAVVDDPAPSVWLTELADSALTFELLAWSRDKLHRPGNFKSELNYAIVKKFRDHGVEIPFPQRDLNLRSGGIKIDAEKVKFAAEGGGQK